MLPFFEYRTDLLRVERGNEKNFPLHLHSELEIMYVNKGTLLTHIDGSTYHINENEAIFVFPNTVHDCISISESNHTDFTLLIYNPMLYSDYQNILNAYIPTKPLIKQKDLHPDIVYSIHAISADPDQKEIVTAFMQIIIHRAIPLLNLAKRTCDTIAPALPAQIIEYISTHYKEHVSLEILSRALNVSKFHISKLFSNILRISLSDYVNTLRINYSKGLLRKSDLAIIDIAFESGFENQQSFNRAFKKYCGITPRQYRQWTLQQTL